MSDQDKKQILQRLTTRVSTGLHFIESEYLWRHDKPDAAYIRNIYILLSFYAELLLKAVFVQSKMFTNITDLDAQLRKLGHNLEVTAAEIGENFLNSFGIKKVELKNHEYIVETESGTFTVKDFVDIRYDFIDGRIRSLDGSEHNQFTDQITIMRKINDLLAKLLGKNPHESSFISRLEDPRSKNS